MTVPHLPHKTGLKMWSAVDRDGCFVKLSRSINFVPPEGYKKIIYSGHSFADFCTCFSLVITPRDRHNMAVSILFVCTATHVPRGRVQKAYLVGIAKSFADFCTCFSPVTTPHNMSVSILFVCTATHVPWRTGRTKVALAELPTVNMFGFFFFTPFPRRILAWSLVAPRSHYHPPKALNLICLKEDDNWASHTCHTRKAWKCDPQLTEMDVLQSFQEA